MHSAGEILFNYSMNRKEKLFKLHYMLWDWLANYPGKSKSHWPVWDMINIRIHVPNKCFLCLYYDNDCSICPLGKPTIGYNEVYFECKLFGEWDTFINRYNSEIQLLKRMLNKEEKHKQQKFIKELRKAITDIAKQIRDIKGDEYHG